MNRIAFLTFRVLVIVLCSCKDQPKTPTIQAIRELIPGLTPLFKLDRDTIMRGDSLTGVIGVGFGTSLTDERRQQLIATLSYRIDTADTDDTGSVGSVFQKSIRLSDTTFRFGILPRPGTADTLSKKSVYPSIKVQFYSLDSQKLDYVFKNRIDYYVAK